MDVARSPSSLQMRLAELRAGSRREFAVIDGARALPWGEGIGIGESAAASFPLVMAVAETCSFGDVVAAVDRADLEAWFPEEFGVTIALNSSVMHLTQAFGVRLPRAAFNGA